MADSPPPLDCGAGAGSSRPSRPFRPAPASARAWAWRAWPRASGRRRCRGQWRGDRCGRRRDGHLRRGCRRGGTRRGRRRAEHRRGGRGARLRGRVAARRIDQQRVRTREVAGGPCEFDDDVDERLLHHLVAGQDEHRAAVGAARQRHRGAREHRVVVDTGRLERLGRRQAHAQGGRLLRAQARHLDFSAQGLAQNGLHVHTPQAQCRGTGRQEDQGSSCHDVQRATSGDQRAILQFGIPNAIRRSLQDRPGMTGLSTSSSVTGGANKGPRSLGKRP